jgi:hypothetical protein
MKLGVAPAVQAAGSMKLGAAAVVWHPVLLPLTQQQLCNSPRARLLQQRRSGLCSTSITLWI